MSLLISLPFLFPSYCRHRQERCSRRRCGHPGRERPGEDAFLDPGVGAAHGSTGHLHGLHPGGRVAHDRRAAPLGRGVPKVSTLHFALPCVLSVVYFVHLTSALNRRHCVSIVMPLYMFLSNFLWPLLTFRYEVEYEEAKRKTKEALHPLKLELAEINDSVSITFLYMCILGTYWNIVIVGVGNLNLLSILAHVHAIGSHIVDFRGHCEDFFRQGDQRTQRRKDPANPQAQCHRIKVTSMLWWGYERVVTLVEASVFFWHYSLVFSFHLYSV